MRQVVLNRLKGMSVKAAVKFAKLQGHESEVIPEGMAITQQARPNTVLLWEKDGVIVEATAGDPTELKTLDDA